MSFVLDNSVVVGWFLVDQATPYTDAVALRLEREQAVVPVLWQLEFANVLRTACKRQRLSPIQAGQIAEQIERLPILVDTAAPGSARLLALALEYNLSSYDAAYLELALRLRMPVASKDEALLTAAVAAGVGIVGV